MTSDYPVRLEVSSPVRFDRVQVLVRIALAIVLGWVGVTAGWLVCLLYGALPVIAAIASSSLGSDRFASDFGPRLWRVLRWLLQLSAFMMLLVDRFPMGGAMGAMGATGATGNDGLVRIEVRATGTPTAGSALLRLVTSIPSGLVLCVLWFVSAVLWLFAAGVVLLGGAMPPPILAFQRGVLRWQARLVAYHASLVEEYPPFSFETDDGRGLPSRPGELAAR